MFDPRSEEPASGNDRWILLGFTAALVAFFAAELVSGFEPAKLSILFMLIAWLPLLVLHEAAHAVAAHTLGWRVEGVVIGFGRTLASRSVLGVPVEFRSLPVEGFVTCRPKALDGVRWKSAFIYFAGPGVEFLFALMILALAGPALLLTRTDTIAVIALQSIALAAALGGVLNLIPHSTFSTGSRDDELPNDGLGIVMSLSRPLAEWEAELRRRRFFRPEDD